MYNIGLVYNKPKNITAREKSLDPRSYRQPEMIANELKEAFLSKGHKVTMIPASENLIQDIRQAGDIDVIFNSCTGLNNKREQANIVGMLELTGTPFVGSGLDAQVTALNKGRANAVFQAAGVPISPFQIFKNPEDPLNEDMKFPLFVKPESEGSGLGITMDSIVQNEKELRERARYVIESFGGSALVEGFLPGREFTVGILGTEDPKALPITEIKLPDDSGVSVQSVDAKADNIILRECPAKLTDDLQEEIARQALAAYNALNCSELARIDIKLDENNDPNIIEINTQPALETGFEPYPLMVKAAGMTMADLAEELVQESLLAWDKEQKRIEEIEAEFNMKMAI